MLALEILNIPAQKVQYLSIAAAAVILGHIAELIVGLGINQQAQVFGVAFLH